MGKLLPLRATDGPASLLPPSDMLFWSSLFQGLDRSGAFLQLQIRQMIVTAIEDGRLPLGVRMPSSRDLASLLKVSRNTIVIAYEPIWAIGTGKVATPDDAQEVCVAIRGRLEQLYSPEVAENVRVLYGGSVKSTNAGEILAQRDIDGALVGGASLDADEFAGICLAARPGKARR